jgi:hypothetical protein
LQNAIKVWIDCNAGKNTMAQTLSEMGVIKSESSAQEEMEERLSQ